MKEIKSKYPIPNAGFRFKSIKKKLLVCKSDIVLVRPG